jgi:GNAT superfamily N-acetyltransferase
MRRPTNGGFTVREVRREDIPSARALMLRTFDEDFGSGYDPRFHADVDDIAGVYIDTPRHVLFVAVDDATDEIIGTGGVRGGGLKAGVSPEALVRRYEPLATAQLVRVYTLREHRRRGVARALVQALLDFIVADGDYSIVSLHTYPDSPGALPFWESIGTLVHRDDRDDGAVYFFEIPLDRARLAASAGR